MSEAQAEHITDATAGKIEGTPKPPRAISVPMGKRTPVGANERVTFDKVEHVQRNGVNVENDHSYLMKMGDQEVWLRKSDMQLSGDGKCSITASHARDMNLPVEGDYDNDGKAKQDPLSQASLGMNSASPSATQKPGEQPKPGGQSKQQT